MDIDSEEHPTKISLLNKIREDIRVVFERDPAARSIPEIFMTCSGFQALFMHRINHKIWQWKLYLLARLFAHITRFFTGIEIHPAASIGRRCFIDHGMGIVIGETTQIGNDVSIYHGVTLGGTTWNKGKRHPTLKNNVLIGAGAKILGPITIGENARVGSNAVVSRDIPKGSTVVGVPGHVVIKKPNKSEQSIKRKTMADKIGFTAYAESKDMPDPIQNALDSILDHMHNIEQQIHTGQKQTNSEDTEQEHNK